MKHRNLYTGLAASLAMLGGAFALSAQEMSDEAAERMAGFERTGETRSCLSLSRISRIEPIDDNHFLVEMRNREVWLNTVRGRCVGASSQFNRLQYRMSGNQLCSGQIIEVVDNGTGMYSGGCGLGQFEQLTPVEQADGASR